MNVTDEMVGAAAHVLWEEHSETDYPGCPAQKALRAALEAAIAAAPKTADIIDRQAAEIARLREALAPVPRWQRERRNERV